MEVSVFMCSFQFLRTLFTELAMVLPGQCEVDDQGPGGLLHDLRSLNFGSRQTTKCRHGLLIILVQQPSPGPFRFVMW